MSWAAPLTAHQVRQACALLRWNSPTLAERAGVEYRLVCAAWSRDTVEDLSDGHHVAIRAALERAGVRFALGAEGRPGAEMRTEAP